MCLTPSEAARAVFFVCFCLCSKEKSPDKRWAWQVKVKVLVAQSCLTLCDPVDCSPPGSSAHGIPQARILESVAISSYRGSSQLRDQTTGKQHIRSIVTEGAVEVTDGSLVLWAADQRDEWRKKSQAFILSSRYALFMYFFLIFGCCGFSLLCVGFL